VGRRPDWQGTRGEGRGSLPITNHQSLVAACATKPFGFSYFQGKSRVRVKRVCPFKELAKAWNTLIIPSNLNDAARFIVGAMTVLDRAKARTDAQKAAKA
jgi:hypothetical protein